jgi:apolipoprotein N-acyltransferase
MTLRNTSIWIPTILALAVVAVIVALAVTGDLPALANSPHQWTPFAFTSLGVTLYVLQAAKRRRSEFDLRYLPDYCFRAAQAAVYLYVIMTVIARGEAHEFASWPPNLIGLFVGLFIEQVEEAVQGVGQRLGDALAVVFPKRA